MITDEETHIIIYKCEPTMHALECLELNISVAKCRITDERLLHDMENVSEAYRSLSEMALSLQEWLDEGVDEGELKAAYNRFRKGREFDD